MSATFQIIFSLMAVLAISFAILMKPYLGLVFTVASQPIADVLPQVPLFSSVVPLIGALTIVSFLIQSRHEHIRFVFRFTGVHILSLLLLLWIFISHPAAAFSGGGRNWVFTLIQLFFLLWFSGFMLTTPQKHKTLMLVFALTAFVSAVFAIIQGGSISAINTEVRAFGLAEGSNTAARYFVIAFVFFNYLNLVEKRRSVNLLLILGIIVTFVGVFYTTSRTGIMLLAIAVFLLVLIQSKFRYRVEIGILSAISLFLILSYSDTILSFIQSIFPSISRGTDTVGLRYALWKAGLQMWEDHPISGVGIGLFASQVRYYPNPHYFGFFSKGIVAHNMYVSMLAETGIIGAALFLGLLLAAVSNFIKTRKVQDKDFQGIQNAWLIVFIVILVGGITKTDQVDKLLWMSLGVSAFFNNYQFKIRREERKQAIRKPLPLEQTPITIQDIK